MLQATISARVQICRELTSEGKKIFILIFMSPTAIEIELIKSFKLVLQETQELGEDALLFCYWLLWNQISWSSLF